MPELAAGFCIGAGLSLVTAFLFFLSQIKYYKSTTLRTLQSNLRLLKLRWNELDGRLEPYHEDADSAELTRAKSNFLIFGVFAVLLSWAGWIFLLLMWFSIEKLVKNRLEDHLLASDIAKRHFTTDEMRDFWLKLQGAGFDSLPVTEQANS